MLGVKMSQDTEGKGIDLIVDGEITKGILNGVGISKKMTMMS
jgi:hypothetical protein